MDFQPAVSIMSVAWLKTEALTTVTQFYKPNAQWRRAGKAEVLQKGSQTLRNTLWVLSEDTNRQKQPFAIWV